MALTRRQFLERTGLCTAGSLIVPNFFSNPFLRTALADTIGDRYFVVLYLDGGNDGLNTVCPASGSLRTWYEAARDGNLGNGGLRLPVGGAGGLLQAASLVDANSGDDIGLHPGLSGLKALYDAPYNAVAVVQGCGYPNYNLSHEVSSRIWQTADPLGAGFGSGWMGRYLGANYTASQVPGVTIDDSIAEELVTNATSVLAIRRLESFGFPYDYDYGSDNGFKRTAFDDMYELVKGSPQGTFDYVGNGGSATLISSESYPALHDLYVSSPARQPFLAEYEAIERGTARGFLEIAKIINGVRQSVPNINARVFQLRNGGYDTHSDQGANQTDGSHYDLHKEVGDALNVFYRDCESMGVADKICIVVWSEFSRRIIQNDNGTDHGSQGPMFVIGGKVNGGVYGNHPHIDPSALDEEENTAYSQDNGNGFRSTDFRDVYGTILKHWLNMPAAQISSTILPADAPQPGEERWTSPNFDLDKDAGATPLFDPTP